MKAQIDPRLFPLRKAAQHVWLVRRMLRDGMMLPREADSELRPLRAHPDPRVAALSRATEPLGMERASERAGCNVPS